jgi:hypothetical protein
VKLRESRLRIEEEITNIDAGKRTVRIIGSIRRAFQLAKNKGRADIDDFLQKNYRKPGVERKLKTINYADEASAIYELEVLLQIFNQKPSSDRVRQEQSDSKFKSTDDPIYSELPELSKDYDPSLELVCWMHIR